MSCVFVGLSDHRIYYGMNQTYAIRITDTASADHGRFSLKRKGEKVSLKDREKVLLRLVKGYAPDELAIQMAKTLPDRQTCYSSIDSCDGRLYVTKSHFVPVNFQEIDIFSTDGRYLFQGIIEIEAGSQINTEPVVKNDHVYLVIEDEMGDVFIAKYKTTMP